MISLASKGVPMSHHKLTAILAGVCMFLFGAGLMSSFAPTSWEMSRAEAASRKKQIKRVKSELRAVNSMLKRSSAKAVPEIYKQLLRKKRRLKAKLAQLLNAKYKPGRRQKVPPRRRLTRHQLMMMWSMPGMRGSARPQQMPSNPTQPHKHEKGTKINNMNNDALVQEQQRLKREKQKEAKLAAKRSARERTRLRACAFYSKGQLHKAKRLFIQIGETNTALQVTRFTASFRTGQRAHNQINPSVAIPSLEQALGFDQRINKTGSVFTKKIRRMLANMYVSRAVYASGQRRYNSAFIYLRSAQKHDPKHHLLRRHMKRIRNIAKRYLQNAKINQKTQPRLARTYLRKAIALTFKHDPIHIEAQKRLATLSP